ncbi:MAG: hypothetical protein NTV00_10380 [Methylococcales bacterium]|nr:hypothetical protein [Methylococcales bacterium]
MLEKSRLTYILRSILAIGVCAAGGVVSVHAQEYVGAVNDPNLFLNPPVAGSIQTPVAVAEKYQQEAANDPYAAENKQLMQLGFAIGVSDMEFQKVRKDNLPMAPQNETGDYYLDLDSPNKAVNLPTKFGTFAVNLDTMRHRQQLSEIQQQINKKILANGGIPSDFGGLKPKNMAYPVSSVFISYISSAYYDNPNTTEIEIDPAGSTFNHGGGWVGAISQEVGLATSYAMSICGALAPYAHSFGVTYYQNGVAQGYWRGMFTQSGCQNGWIQSAAIGANGTVYSPVVYFY